MKCDKYRVAIIDKQYNFTEFKTKGDGNSSEIGKTVIQYVTT
jgi:hypothetical protein